MVRLTDEYARWWPHLGWQPRRCDQWAPFSILKDRYGWKILTTATMRCEANDAGFKSSNTIGKICATLKKEADDAAKQAAQDAARTELKEKAKAKGRLVKDADGTWKVVEV